MALRVFNGGSDIVCRIFPCAPRYGRIPSPPPDLYANDGTIEVSTPNTVSQASIPTAYGIILILNTSERATTVPPSVSLIISSVSQRDFIHIPSHGVYVKFSSEWELVDELLFIPRVLLTSSFEPHSNFHAWTFMDSLFKLKSSLGYFYRAQMTKSYHRKAWCFFYGKCWDEHGHGYTPLHAAVDANDELGVVTNAKYKFKYSDGPVHETAWARAVRLHRWNLADLIYEWDPKITEFISFTSDEWLRTPFHDALHRNDLDAMKHLSLMPIYHKMLPVIILYFPTAPGWFLENVFSKEIVMENEEVHTYRTPEILHANAYNAFRLRQFGFPARWKDPQTEFIKPIPSQRDERTLQQRCAACILHFNIATDKLPKVLVNWILK